MRTFVGKFTLSICLVLLPLSAFADKVVGTLAVVKGQVEIKEKSGKSIPAKMGAKVKEKDTIVCGKDSRAKLVMIDQNVLNISPETEINLETYKFEPEKNEKNVVLNVLYGKVRSTVNQKYDGEENKYNVKTPAAVAGVRGTDFLAGYDNSSKQSNFVTFKGLVQVGVPGPGGAILNPVSVGPGMSTTASVGSSPSQPMAVPKNQLVQMGKDSTADGSGKTEHREPAGDNGNSNNKGNIKSPDNNKGGAANNNTAPTPGSGSGSGSGSSSSSTANSSSSSGSTAPAPAASTTANATPSGSSAAAVPAREPTSIAPTQAPTAPALSTPSPLPGSSCTFACTTAGSGPAETMPAPPPPTIASPTLPPPLPPSVLLVPQITCPPICPPTGKTQLSISIGTPQ